MKKTILISILAFLLVVGIASAITMSVDELKGLLGEQTQEQTQEEILGISLPNAPRNVIGTRVATTTTGVGFYGAITGSTTYPTFIGREIDTAVYTIDLVNATSTYNVYFSILGSQDNQCDTASTTYSSAYNNYLTSEIQWFDVGDHLKDKVHSTSLSAATSTIVWINPIKGTKREIILEDLNVNCLALEVAASSTVLQAQITTKQK